ncbi:PREDICTED: probable G-protein coupled receptor Mth-like 5 [Nicrophorus vespilloides]|uniref:Probable G-protein coupled receptor Mth-like 5 n=1 Tax=Nicrophorus vespilloides TaxID=110193 RepID=A0ABM1M1V3_NICVS|nr:PREDICTED: probable G-protein coupled receptor Mth-like 5 [Nicrophorus vespilloides]
MSTLWTILSTLIVCAWCDPSLSKVRVNKCCEENEIYVQNYCTNINETRETKWRPIFTSEHGRSNQQIDYFIATGSPDCGSHQQWSIYHYVNSQDVLRLLPNGKLRHYINRPLEGEEEEFEEMNKKKMVFYDYDSGKYCLDKRVENGTLSEYALVCDPKHENHWTNEMLMRNIVNPVTHIVAIGCFLAVLIFFLVMPPLKDLVGRVLLTITLCLLINQVADLIRLLTVFKSNVSIIVTETVSYVSLLGAFFWLNSLGYCIWKIFKSRNAYLRMTDYRQYRYYSLYAWLSTAVTGFLAIFAHYTLDYEVVKSHFKNDEQEQIGSLAMIIFFVPVAFTVLVNVFIVKTIIKLLRTRRNSGQIYKQLKRSFRMFVLVFLVMSVNWVFFLMSFSTLDGLVYCYIIVNTFQAPLYLYICLIKYPKSISKMIRDTCCYDNCRQEPEYKWSSATPMRLHTTDF